VQLAAAVHSLGSRARYIQMSGSGRNALDFHIACYLGQLTVQHPDAHFTIISKDAGYDPIISHLKQQGIRVKRSQQGCSAPKPATAAPPKADPPKASVSTDCTERAQFEAAFDTDSAPQPGLEEILRFLLKTTTPRPRSAKALANLIKSSLKCALDDNTLARLLKLLDKAGKARLVNERLEWVAMSVAS
jgi:hypothetical protein